MKTIFDMLKALNYTAINLNLLKREFVNKEGQRVIKTFSVFFKNIFQKRLDFSLYV